MMDAVEVDLRRCRSGEVVLFHDADLAPLTGHEGRLSETDWETLRTLTVLGSDERVPRVADAVGFPDRGWSVYGLFSTDDG